MKRSMKRVGALCLTVLLVLFSLAPVFGNNGLELEMSTRPLEQVIAQSGSWHTTTWSDDELVRLVVGYTGNPEEEGSSGEIPQFELGGMTGITGLYLPARPSLQTAPSLTFRGSDGRSYGPFRMEIRWQVEQPDNPEMPFGLSSQEEDGQKICFWTPVTPLALDTGLYTIELSDPSVWMRPASAGGKSPYLVKGVNQEGMEQRLMQNLGMNPDDFSTGNPDDADADDGSDNGNSPVDRQLAVFTVREESVLLEIIFNTFNEGFGAEPGAIALLDDELEILEIFETWGEPLAGVENGTWVAEPEVILPPGTYRIGVSDPDVLVYREDGTPEFEVLLAPLGLQTRTDFTGTYRIDLKSFILSTRMGMEDGTRSTFSLDDFELVVLDKGDSVELIGRYEGVPYSLGLPVVDGSATHLVAELDFEADYTNVAGVNAKITAGGFVVFQDRGERPPTIELVQGSAVYERSESSHQGADYNTYRVDSRGRMVSPDLPVFVLAAMGSRPGAGPFPGPGSPVQAATGLLFPPLVGLAVSLLQDTIKPKPKPSEGILKYTYQYFRKKFPNATKHQIAMMIYAVSVPDPDSRFKLSDPKKTDKPDPAEGPKPIDDYGDGPEDAASDPWERDDPEAGTGRSDGGDLPEGTEGRPGPDEQYTGKPDSSGPEEPDTREFMTGADGRKEWFTKDPETGQWHHIHDHNRVIDPDSDAYRNAVSDEQRQRYEDTMAKHRHDNVSGDTVTDRENRRVFDQIRQDEEHQSRINRLLHKHRFSNEDDLWSFLDQQNEHYQAQSARMQSYANTMGKLERTAEWTVIGADVAIDGLANLTAPLGGRYIRAGYQVIRDVGGNVAEGGFTVQAVGSGLISSGSSILVNSVDSGALKKPFGNVLNSNMSKQAAGYAQKTVKTGIKLGGKVTADALKNARDESGNFSFAHGLEAGKKSAGKAVRGLIVDEVAGQITNRIGGADYGDYTTQMKSGGMTRLTRYDSATSQLISGRTVTNQVADKFVRNKLTRQAKKSGMDLATNLLKKEGFNL